MATVGDVIVSRLCEAGVRTLFGMPGGGSNLDVIEAAGHAGLPFVLTQTETAGAIAAIAQTDVTGHPGACLTTLGPGVTSVVNGIACAFLDRAPIVVLTDTHPRAAGGMFEHQQIDHRALLAPVTKWSASLTSENADEVVCRAIAIATTPPFGPVHLDCPSDVTPVNLVRRDGGGQVLWDPALAANESNRVQRTRPADDWEALLSTSHRPMLLVGLGARRAADAEAIRALCEARHVPAMVTYKAKGVVADESPWFAGVFTNAAIEQAALDESDLLIGVGFDPVELIPRAWTRTQPIIACGPAAFDARHVPFSAQLLMDVPGALREMQAALPMSAWNREGVRGLAGAQRARLSIGGGRMTAQDVVRVASARLAGRGRVTVDAGAHMFPIMMLWPCSEPGELLISNGLSTMGFALPAAIGAALAEGDRPVIALTGDAGLLMCVAELATAVRHRLRIIMIVFADAALSLIQIKQEQRRYRPAGVCLPPIDWPALAAGFGAAAWSASTGTELDRAIEQALAAGGVSVIEAKIDPGNYGETLRAIRG